MSLSLRLRPTKPGDKWLLLLTALLMATAVVFWRPAQREILSRLVLRSDTAAENVVEELATQAKDSSAFLERLWQTQKLPHRLAAVSYLEKHAGEDPVLLSRCQQILLDAGTDGDLQVRELALKALAKARHTEVLRLAKEQLRDADPAARVVGLELVRQFGDSRLVPVVMPLLDDSHPFVVVNAANALRRWTGQDFGVRLSQASRKFGADPAKPSASVDAVRQLGVRHWKDWWQLHRADYPDQAAEAIRPQPTWRLAAPDFALVALDGRVTRLGAHKGKIVLLQFWSTAIPDSLLGIPALIAVQQRNANRVAVIGICLDGAGYDRCCDESCCKDGQHQHQSKSNSAFEVAHRRARLRQLVADRKIDYPVLLDPTGSVAQRFAVRELPDNLLIDSEGYVRRHFTGGRTVETLEVIINETPNSGLATLNVP